MEHVTQRDNVLLFPVQPRTWAARAASRHLILSKFNR